MQRVFGDYDSLRFVDGWLDDDRRAAFQHHLSADPAEAERVALWARQNEALRAAFASVATEPVPPALRLGPAFPAGRSGGNRAGASLHVLPATRGRPRIEERVGTAPHRGVRHRVSLGLAGLALAAAVVLLAVRALMQGGGLPREPLAGSPALIRAADAHLTYAAEPFRPDASVALDAAALTSAMWRRAALNVAPPDLSSLGWVLRSSRLVPGVDGPAAFFIYADAADERLGVYVGRVRDGSAGVALGTAGSQGAALAWEHGSATYVITTGQSADWLSRNGQHIRAAVDRAAS